MVRSVAHAVTILMLLAVWPGPVEAQAPHGRPWAANVVVPQSRVFVLHRAAAVVPARPVPVRVGKVRAGVMVRERVAITTLDIELENPAGFRQEAELLVPVPDGAAVRGFDFQGAAKEPTARLLPADEARRAYRAIVARVRDPALLEFAGHDLVRSSVFPVEARGSQKVRLTYEHLLAAEGDRVDYILPRSEALDHQVPWTISVSIESKQKVVTVYSPSHEIETIRKGPHRVSVRTRAGQRQPGPFRLSWLAEAGDDLCASLYAYPDPAFGGGYFLLLAGLPPPADDERAAIKREVTLVLDRSGSMNGEKLEQVREAARQVLAGLEDGEAFNLIAYNQEVEAYAAEPVIKTSESIARARAWLDGIRPLGGTNIHDALVEALRQKPRRGMLPIVLFLTDGLPTIGQTSERAIRRQATRGNRHHKRIFTFGVGVDVNTALLGKMAAASRAFATFVLPGEDVEVKVARVFKGLAGPVLAEPRLLELQKQATPGALADVLPRRLPDLFEGDHLVVLGRYRARKQLRLAIHGNHLGTPRTFRMRFDLSKASTRNGFVPRLWASRQIARLVDEIRSSGADADRMVLSSSGATSSGHKELVDEIVRLSTQFGVLTEYTAFLAREGTNLGRRDQVMAQAQKNFQQRAVRVRSGLGSVNQDMNRQSMSQQAVLNPTNAFYDHNMERVSVSSVQQVADRTFWHRGGRWVDSRLVDRGAQAKPSKTIAFGSEEFMDLARRLARQGRQGTIALRGDILLAVDGQVVLIRGPDAP